MVSKNSTSTSRLSRSATAKNTASCTSAWASASISRSIARYAWSSSIDARAGIAASQVAHSAADSFERGSTQRFATNANSTRSTSAVNEPAAAQHLPQRGVDAQLTPQPVEQPHRPERPGVSHGQRVADRLKDVVGAGGLAEVAVDRRDQPSQPVRVELVLPAEVEQHLRLRHALDPTVVRQ